MAIRWHFIRHRLPTSRCHVHASQRRMNSQQKKNTRNTQSSVPMSNAQWMMGTRSARGQQNRQQGAWKIKGWRIHIMTSAPCRVQMPVPGLACIVKCTRLLFGQYRPSDQQIVMTNFGPIPYVVEACLALPEFTEAHQAMCTRNIPSHVRLNSVSFKHVDRVRLV